MGHTPDGEDFIGRRLLAQESGVPRRLVAFKTHGKVPARHGYPVVNDEGETIDTSPTDASPSLQAIIEWPMYLRVNTKSARKLNQAQ